MYINANLTCGDPVSSPYYSQKLGPTVCNRCAQLIDDPKLVAEIGSLTLSYSIVLPSCGETCGEHIVKRKRKRALKKVTQADRKRKKRKMKEAAKPTPAWLQRSKEHWNSIRNKVKKDE